MKEGTKVKVLCCLGGHGFQDGDVVERRFGQFDDGDSVGFYSEKYGLWYMKPEEYKIVDSNNLTGLLQDALTLTVNKNMSKGLLKAIELAIQLAEQEVEDK